jgi:hypothetical protein
MIFAAKIQVNWPHHFVVAQTEGAVVDFVYFHAQLYMPVQNVFASPA